MSTDYSCTYSSLPISIWVHFHTCPFWTGGVKKHTVIIRLSQSSLVGTWTGTELGNKIRSQILSQRLHTIPDSYSSMPISIWVHFHTCPLWAGWGVKNYTVIIRLSQSSLVGTWTGTELGNKFRSQILSQCLQTIPAPIQACQFQFEFIFILARFEQEE